MAVVGAYLMYLAYGLFKDRMEPDTGMSPAARYAFIALFVIAGAAILVYAWKLWMRSRKPEEEQKPQDDEEQMK